MLSYEPWAQTRSYGCVLLEMPTTQEMFCAVTLRTPPKCPRPPQKNSWLRYASPQYAHAHAVLSGCRYVTLGVMPKCCLHYGRSKKKLHANLRQRYFSSSSQSSVTAYIFMYTIGTQPVPHTYRQILVLISCILMPLKHNFQYAPSLEPCDYRNSQLT